MDVGANAEKGRQGDRFSLKNVKLKKDFNMVTVIKKGSNKKEIEEALSKLRSTKKFDAYKYCGTVKLNEDPLEIQKKMRDEWE